MASSTASSSSLTRYPRWVWALTGLTAAYATYTIWTALDFEQRSAASGLHRRGAIRQSRRRSQPRGHPQLSMSIQIADPDPDPSESDVPPFPFGTITARNGSQRALLGIGPLPPSLAQLEEVLDLPPGSWPHVHYEVQNCLLDRILECLTVPSAEELLTSNGPLYTSLIPLIAPLRDRNISDLLGLVHLLAGRDVDDPDPEAEPAWRYDQTNVTLAFARRCGIDVTAFERDEPQAPEGDDADFPETVVGSDLGPQTGGSGSGIKSLLYTIAEEQAKRAAYVHRGTRCDSCGELPIRGVRWHCMNCPDYDLCSSCEGQYPVVHPPTHIFAKIRIPVSTLAQPHQVVDSWYPGDPKRHWAPLKPNLRKRLVAETGFDNVTLEAYYEQFTCTANVEYPHDPSEINAAIDRKAFTKAMTSDRWPAPLEPNLLFDRMFNFYDTDNNELIGFEEFLHGIAYLRQPKSGYPAGKRRDLSRVLNGYDLDGDGLLDRSDFVRMLSAKYAIQRHLICDKIATEEEEIAVHTMDVVNSSQPISAAFTHEDVPFGERRDPDMKRVDAFGDLQVAVDPPLGSILLPDEREIWDGPTLNAVSRRYGQFDDIIPGGQPFALAHAEEMRDRYNRVESVPIPEATTAEPSRFLVETDSRRSRGRTSLEPAQARWTTDLDDFLAFEESGPDHGSSQNGITPRGEDGRADDTMHDSRSSERDTGNAEDATEAAVPDFIFNRGRAHDVPRSEVGFGRDVLYQVIQEGFNELLDPLFLEREGLAENVRKTRAQRLLWRAAIDKYKEDKQAFVDELKAGSDEDLSSASATSFSAPPAVTVVMEQHDVGYPEGPDRREPTVALSNWAFNLPALQAHIGQRELSWNEADQEEARTHIQQRLFSNLVQDLRNFEYSDNQSREQTLEELLSATGYTIDPPAESERSDSPAESEQSMRLESTNNVVADDVVSEPSSADPTLPQNRPNDATSLLSPSPGAQPESPGRSRSNSVSPNRLSKRLPEEQQNNNDELEAFEEPSQTRLDYYCRLEEEERNILERGGPGRLTFAEIEEICRRDGSGALRGLVDGWLDWAAF